MGFINDIIYEQNMELLERIALDMFDSGENRKLFIKKYHKKNFSYLNNVKKDIIPEYHKKFSRLMRLN